MQTGYQIFTCPFGELLVAGTENAVTHIIHGQDRSQLGSDFLMTHDNVSAMARNPFLELACEKIQAYLEGKSPAIRLPVRLGGTDFQRQVWNALRLIPYGATTSYSALAESLGMPEAFRAVANACGSNPVPLIIPCHRVIHKNGEVSGFAWGIEAKKYLLGMEKKFSESFLAAA